MQVFRGVGEISPGWGPTVVSIGNFDGVHLGHQFILERVRQSASARSLRSVAVTFDPHPLRFLRPDSCPRLITPLETKLELLGDTGVDAVLVLPFTAELSRMRAAEFVTTIVHDALGAVEVHEGTNFRFGYRAEGGTVELNQLGRKLGFDVAIHGACQVRGLTCSSSKIRELLSRGDIRTAPRTAGARLFCRFHAGPWTRNRIHAHRSHHQPGALPRVAAAKRRICHADEGSWGVVRCGD